MEFDEKDYTIEQSGNGWILKSKGDYALPYGKTIAHLEYDAKALVASNGTVVIMQQLQLQLVFQR